MKQTILLTLTPNEAAALGKVVRSARPLEFLDGSQLEAFYSALDKLSPQLREIAVP